MVAQGTVIRRRDQGETDRVLTLYAPLGKIKVIAKGARKLRSRDEKSPSDFLLVSGSHQRVTDVS
jgi:recombinational DNA repair protein (RecF pathway)